MAKRVLNMSLCNGRHKIRDAKDGFIFPQIIPDILDVDRMERAAYNKLKEIKCFYTDVTLNLYVTGYTPALVAALNAAKSLNIKVVLYHRNKETGGFFTQTVK